MFKLVKSFRDFLTILLLVFLGMSGVTVGVFNSIQQGTAIRPWAGILGLVILFLAFTMGLIRPFISGYKNYIQL